MKYHVVDGMITLWIRLERGRVRTLERGTLLSGQRYTSNPLGLSGSVVVSAFVNVASGYT